MIVRHRSALILGCSLLGALLPLGASAAAPASAAFANVIPAPASVTARPGSFTLTEQTLIFVRGGRRADRIAAYFGDLLRTSHGMKLKVRHAADAAPPAPGVVFRLDPAAPGSQAGS